MDKLDKLFELQARLNDKIGVRPESFSDEDRKAWILKYARAMSQEIAELTDSVPWKWWADYQNFDPQNIKVELVDLLHFLISSFQVMGLESEDVFRLYTQKHEVNLNRQKDGYKVKETADCRHIK